MIGARCSTQYERTPPHQQPALSPHEAFAKVVSLCGSLIYLEEALALYRMTLGCQLAVEIGAYKGASTCMMALGIASTGVLLSIDPHGGVADNTMSWAGAGTSTIEPLRLALTAVGAEASTVILPTTSKNAAGAVEYLLEGRQLDAVFVDGSHLQEDVAFDLEFYGGRVRVGGFLAIDDVSMIGVGAALEMWNLTKQGFRPHDLTTWGICDGVHGHEKEGRVHKMLMLERTSR